MSELEQTPAIYALSDGGSKQLEPSSEVIAHTSGTACVWPGLANGKFGLAVASFSGTLDIANIDGSGHYIVGVADVTGNGKADLIRSAANKLSRGLVWHGVLCVS